MSDALLDINKIRPFAIEDNIAVASASGSRRSPLAGPSSDRAGLNIAESSNGKKRKDAGENQVIDLDEPDMAVCFQPHCELLDASKDKLLCRYSLNWKDCELRMLA